MPLSLKDLYRFDEFELDPLRRTLVRNGTPVLISPKALEVLTYLVRHPGRVVTKDELLKAVWPDSFVEESNLAQHISWLRKAFADKAGCIVTVPGRGYQFAAEVHTQSCADLLPDKTSGAVLVHAVRQRTHMVIEESSQELSPGPEAVITPSPSAPLDYSAARPAAPKARAWTIGVASVLAVGALVAAYFGYKKLANGPPHPVAIAVLPFTNLTGDRAKEYLSNGVTEEMINSLARSAGGHLRVIARTSSMAYKDTRKAVPEIARELGVQYVLEGSVQSEGNRLHVMAQLIRSSDQTHLWADTFDGDASQILEFESRLTGAVAHSLSLTLLAGATPEHTPVDSATHDAYLKGLFFLSQRSRAGLEHALESFAAATASDPHYGPAYAQLATTYNLMGEYGWTSSSYAHSLGKAAAEQAIAAEPSLGEAHAALGFSKWFYEWDAGAGEKELLRAIQLDPDSADAHHWYSQLLMTSGRFTEAEQQMHAALALDPKSFILRTNLGWLYYFERRYPLAIAQMKNVAGDAPDFVTAHYKLWQAYSVSGDETGAWSECQQLVRLLCKPEDEKKVLAAYQQGGYASALRTFGGISPGEYSGSGVEGSEYMIFAGDKARALDFLERAYRDRDGWMVFVPVDPAFDSLRGDSRFTRLLHEVRPSSTPVS